MTGLRLPLALAGVALLLTGCAGQPGQVSRSASDAGGRSVVGMARRSDGSLVMVTAWCLGERTEEPRIATWDGRVGEELYAASGPSSDPVTVHEVGRPAPGFTLRSNRPLPTGRTLVAHNAGERQELFRQRAYPSTVAVFDLGDLPTSDDPVPERLITGERQRTTAELLIAGKCANG
ncbi:hypothetical protein BI335_08105 [Enemella evansiae]|uniref:hypothetical protein n=1 Tax=Enemella evansiae TaxID=2016499 RepID=UPI000B965D8A|nr:hypothetical protein [Enemella evansiae]OYO18187.1 hypothetical protein BI335_08105 [Enemella evansiae]